MRSTNGGKVDMQSVDGVSCSDHEAAKYSRQDISQSALSESTTYKETIWSEYVFSHALGSNLSISPGKTLENVSQPVKTNYFLNFAYLKGNSEWCKLLSDVARWRERRRV